MKKVLDQTVRDLKREVNKKVLKVPSIEQKTLDATSNEPWGPQGSLLAEIVQASFNLHDYQLIMSVLWRRMQDTGKNWRHVYKALSVLEFLAIHGPERVIDDVREHAYQISILSDFLYTDSNGRDQGINVRRKSQNIVALLNNKGRLQEVRHKSLSSKDNSHKLYSGRTSLPPLCSMSRENDDQFGKDGIEVYNRDDNYRVYTNGDNQHRQRSQSADGYTSNSFDDYGHYSNRVDASPSYEEATNASNPDVQNNIDVISLQKDAISGGKVEDPSKSIDAESTEAPVEEVSSFDDFDPRGSVSVAASNVVSSVFELDIFGDSSAPMLIKSPVKSHPAPTENEENPFGDSPFKATVEEEFPTIQASVSDLTGDILNGILPWAVDPAPESLIEQSQPSDRSLCHPSYNSSEFGSSNPFACKPYHQPPEMLTTGMNSIEISQSAQSGPSDPTANSRRSAKPSQQDSKFEPKSAVWADTISRGLINLNLSGAKTNPLADIGIDFDDINRKERRNEARGSQTSLPSTSAMGKAMGAGSGLGIAGANSLAQPLYPAIGGGGKGPAFPDIRNPINVEKGCGKEPQL